MNEHKTYVAWATEIVISAAERRLSKIHGSAVKLNIEFVEPKEMSPMDIIETVSAATEIPVLTMKSKTRKREVVEARQIAMSIIYENSRLSLKAIGQLFGGRDHSTVIHSRDTVDDLVETDKHFRFKYNRCRSLIKYRITAGNHATPQLLIPATI